MSRSSQQPQQCCRHCTSSSLYLSCCQSCLRSSNCRQLCWQTSGSCSSISTAAAQLLADAFNADGSLSEAVKQRVLSGQALPACLQPLLKSLLLSVFGDLEAVWADAELQKQLLGLSIAFMEVLLSCDELKVATEDTVLYTLHQYLKGLSSAQWRHARRQLAPLVCWQHLSVFWLTASVMSDAAGLMPLNGLQRHVKKLALLRNPNPAQSFNWSRLQPGCERTLQGAPKSWQLGQRCLKPVNSVTVTCRVNVSQLRKLAQRAAAGAEEAPWYQTRPPGDLVVSHSAR